MYEAEKVLSTSDVITMIMTNQYFLAEFKCLSVLNVFISESSGACAGESISDCKKTLPPPFVSRSSQCAIHLSDFIIFLKNKLMTFLGNH